MSGILNGVMNLRIGMKLAITSGIGILLVAAMIASQMVGNKAVKSDYRSALTAQSVSRIASEAKAAIHSMQISVHDVQLAANAEGLKLASDHLAASHESAGNDAEQVSKTAQVMENRERAGKMRTLIDQYVAGAREIAALKNEVFATSDAARVASLNEQMGKLTRERTLPVATELETLANKISEAAVRSAEHQIAAANDQMASAELNGEIFGVIAILVLIGSVFFSRMTIAKPMQVLTDGMLELANGNFDVVLPGLGRKDEIGDIAQAVETFKVKSAEKARAEAQANADRELKEAAAKAERDRIAAQEKAEEERRAAAARDAALAQVMNEFDAAVGGIAKAAMAGDFSQRVSLEGKDGVIRNLAETMNTMCENIGRVVDDLVSMLGALADGDLSRRIDANYQGKFGALKDSANTTAGRLSETISEIKASAAEVSNAAAEISTSTTDLSQRTEEQAAGLEETSASMEEISVTVKKNAENAQQANTLTNATRGVADRGGAVVAEAVTAMARIEESSRKIADIIGVIDEIARQTNLLALNAAVEAARAGDAGRGFAVVASEVRSLAQRSSQAAKDIKDLITNSSSQVREGVDLVNRAGTSLNEIVESIKRVSEIVADIATASSEQSTGLDQINLALSQMDEVTQQNSALVEENAATAKTLEQQSVAMDQRVASFRLAANAGGVAPPATIARPAAPKPVAARSPAATKGQPASKARPAPASGGPVGRMQAGLATALDVKDDFAEF